MFQAIKAGSKGGNPGQWSARKAQLLAARYKKSRWGLQVVMADPKKGTGKKPKGSDRRLYTDENPRDTVSIKYATVKDAKETIAKVKRINKPYARKIQILTVLEQRARFAGKTQKRQKSS